MKPKEVSPAKQRELMLEAIGETREQVAKRDRQHRELLEVVAVAGTRQTGP